MGYVMANTIETKADDHSAQIQKMNSLFDQSKEGLDRVKGLVNEFKNTQALKECEGMEIEPLRYLDQETWRVEIDIENVNDLIRRLSEDSKQNVREKLKSLMPSIF